VALGTQELIGSRRCRRVLSAPDDWPMLGAGGTLVTVDAPVVSSGIMIHAKM
jgi:hypothetical protein